MYYTTKISLKHHFNYQTKKADGFIALLTLISTCHVQHKILTEVKHGAHKGNYQQSISKYLNSHIQSCEATVNDISVKIL